MASEKLSNSNAAKKRGSASNTVLATLFVVGAVVVINLIGTRVFGRVDLTEQKIYTLSQSSKDLVKNLPDFMNVKAFISEDLPPELKTVSRYVRDLVDEYKTGSQGRQEA
jgi:ABC-2 type transport system permease protein